MKLKTTILILMLTQMAGLCFSDEPGRPFEDPSLNMYYSPVPARKFRPVPFVERWSFGLKGGVNFSMVFPDEQRDVFSGPSPEDYTKTYLSFVENLGTHLGVVAMFEPIRQVKISTQPMLGNYAYKYNTEYIIPGDTNAHYLLQCHQNLRMFEFPIIAGYYFVNKTWQPYVQGGVYYAYASSTALTAAVTETLTVNGTDDPISVRNNAINSTPFHQKHHMGLLGGGGIQYLADKIHFGLELNYRFLITKLRSDENGPSNNPVVPGLDAVADDIWFSNLALTFNVLIPIQSRRESALPFCD
jgi:hypothetical protein